MKWSIEEIPVKELSTGVSLTIKVFTLDSGRPGPHVHIQSSVHGAEIQGNAVILQLMERLKSTELVGSLSIIPLANPYATLNKHGTYTYGRYNPVTGDNWNRNYVDLVRACKVDLKIFVADHLNSELTEVVTAYKSLLQKKFESHYDQLIRVHRLHDNNKINLILQGLSLKADGILDLHTGPTATRYLYSSESFEAFAKALLFKNVLVIPDEFAGAMDEAAFMPWAHLRREFAAQGRTITFPVDTFTLEFGSEETFQMDEGEKDVESIINYLRYKKMVPGKVKSLDKVHYSRLENYKTIFSPSGGLVDFHLSPGDHFKEGDILAVIYQMHKLDPLKPLESTSRPILAPEAGIVINRCPSSNVHQGMELFQIMTQIY